MAPVTYEDEEPQPFYGLYILRLNAQLSEDLSVMSCRWCYWTEYICIALSTQDGTVTSRWHSIADICGEAQTASVYQLGIPWTLIHI